MYIKAQGNSMVPTLKNGECYAVELIDNGLDISIGDIIVYCIDQLVVCHRVINIIHMNGGRLFFRTKGDNCAKADGWAVTTEMIVGRVII